MKYLIISDIHSNYDALSSVLEYRNAHFPETELICLGDIVGYAAEPEICVKIISSLTDKIVLGNHDAGVIGKTDLRYFNPSAREAVLWTRGKISKDSFKKLNQLSYVLHSEDFLAVHSSPTAPEYWNYINSIYEAQDELKSCGFDLVFVGHTHIPLVYRMNNEGIRMLFDEKIKLEAGSRYIVNTGSVGQPRNEDNRACAVLYDNEEKTIEYIKLGYDIEKAQEKILTAHLPAFLAERLKRGL